jgi:hypothetical protein
MGSERLKHVFVWGKERERGGRRGLHETRSFRRKFMQINMLQEDEKVFFGALKMDKK